jgi:hypothetical protein
VLFDSEEPSTLIRSGRRTLTLFGQLGTAFGLAITTIVYNAVLERDSRSLGVDLGVSGPAAAPRVAQLHAYQDASWGAFAFGILGKLTCCVSFLGLCALLSPSVVAVPSDPPLVLNGQSLRTVHDYGMCYSKFGRLLMLPPFLFLTSLPLPWPPALAACLIGVVSMAKVGIVGHREDARPEGDTVELGER